MWCLYINSNQCSFLYLLAYWIVSDPPFLHLFYTAKMLFIDFHKQMLDNKKHSIWSMMTTANSFFFFFGTLHTNQSLKAYLKHCCVAAMFSPGNADIVQMLLFYFAFVLIKIADCFFVYVLRSGESVFPVVLRVFVVPFCWSPSITEISRISSASFTGWLELGRRIKAKALQPDSLR